MRGRSGLLHAAIAAAGLTLACSATIAQEIKLTFADQNAPAGWGPSNATYPWLKQVEAATKGRVKFQTYPTQTLVKGVDMWKAASAGTIDVGWCVQSYWPELTPLSDVISLPGLPLKSAEHASEVLWKLYERFPAMQREYAAANIEPLVLYSTHPATLLTTKKVVRTMDDLKGMKIRIVGGPATAQAKALGIVPTPMPMPDVYQALDKGVIDGAQAVWEAIYAFRLYEIGTNFTVAPMSTVYFSICANKRKFDSLPAEVKAQIKSVSGLAGAKFWGRNFFDTAEKAVLDKLGADKKGFQRTVIDQAESARWTKLSEPIWEDWVKRLEGRGIKDAREVLKATLELAKQ